MNNFEKLRQEYNKDELRVNEINNDPIAQFATWMEDAVHAEIPDPNAMVLSTVSEKGIPSSRTVLLKAVSKNSFVFFTNYESKKALEIDKNPNVSLLFFWQVLERQVRIEGKAEKIDPDESDRYFETRPEGSRLGAWASPQSRRIPNRSYLETLEKDYKKMFDKKPVKRPPHWGGYAVKPFLIEFWQGRKNRLHDRIEYTKKEHIWEIHRLAP